MSGDQMRLAVYDLTPECTHLSRSSATVCFVCKIEGQVEADGSPVEAGAEVDAFVDLGIDARGWLFEAAPADAPAPDGQLVLSRIVAPEGRTLLRLDRVASATGGETPPHRHRGLGIRRLVMGEVLAKVGPACDRITPGMA